tara:strand:+ start:1065 stop:1517 length:453 start_codon:yes stop_codon:yes gene_type:complete
MLIAQKFGHVNSLQLLQEMPDVTNAEKSLEEHGNQLKMQIQNMYMEYQNKVAEYQRDEATMLESIKEMKLNDIQSIQQRIAGAEQTAQQDLLKKKEELYAPILKKVEDAISAVAKENSFAYIFDTSSGSVLFAQDSDDVSSMVKKKLNMD